MSQIQNDDDYACLLELCDRVEALEAGLKRACTDHILLANATAQLAQDRNKFFADLLGDEGADEEEINRRFQECLEIINNSKPTPSSSQTRSSLVERVAFAIDSAPVGGNDASEARAAIREVAAWLKKHAEQ